MKRLLLPLGSPVLWMAALATLGTGAGAQNATQAQALRDATKTAKGIRDMTGGKPAAKVIPAGDPCTILSLADVQKIFPGVKRAERSKRLEDYGTTECGWKDASGGVMVVVQESYNEGASAKEDALGMAQGFTDPLRRRHSRTCASRASHLLATRLRSWRLRTRSAESWAMAHSWKFARVATSSASAREN